MSKELKCPYADKLTSERYIPRFSPFDSCLRDDYCKHKGKFCGSDRTGYYSPDDEFTIIDRNEMCTNASIFGNHVFKITEADIEALRNGKVLYDLDEYGTFIVYDKGEE